jgi:hypothetical protein
MQATTQNRLVYPTRRPLPWSLVGLALVVLPSAALAQVSPTSPPHPTFPWGLGLATPQGQLIRYIYVPPEAISLEYQAPGAIAPPAPAEPEQTPAGGEAKPDEGGPAQSTPPAPQILRQDITIPGYYVRETTAGFHYPERWTVEPAGPNLYRWRQIPPQFVPK